MSATLLIHHLWQSSLFALAAWALTVILRQYSARTRYWIWFAASLKFLIPFSVLAALGAQLRPSTATGIELLPAPLLSVTLTVTEPLSVVRSVDTLFDASWGAILLAVWILGSAIVIVRWGLCWLHARSVLRAATPVPIDIDIEARVSSELREPGVFGIFRPTLLLPSAIVSRLSPAELEAVIAHELCHVRHRDNLTAAIHMLIEAIFWYFPVVWWIGRQMLKEREHACDESVIEHGASPRTYAEGILKACRLSLGSRMGVVAAAGGSNLAHRVEAIISWRPARRLDYSGKAGLALLAMGSVVLPLMTGFAMPLTARSHPAPGMADTPSSTDSQHFDFAWIEPAAAHSQTEPRLALSATHLSMQNTSLRKLISVASGLSERQVLGGPVWLDERYDIEATARSPINRRMILDLLTEKFGLRFVEQNLGSSTEPL